MASVINLASKAQGILNKTKKVDFIAPLLVRLYLIPVFWMAGTSKATGFKDTVAWFGNKEYGLGLPAPEVMVSLAMTSEILGAVFLLVGFAVRWISIPLMITMLVAAFSVHATNGWLAIADPKACLFNCEKVEQAIERKEKAITILKEHGNYKYLTEKGNFVVLNNGIEFAATYFILLLMLFFYGGGRASIDHLIARKFNSPGIAA